MGCSLQLTATPAPTPTRAPTITSSRIIVGASVGTATSHVLKQTTPPSAPTPFG